MIEKLTDEQEKQLEIYREKYINIGLNTDRINKRKTEKNVNEFYTKILDRKKPEYIIFCDSPLESWLSLCFYLDIHDKAYIKVNAEVNDKVYAEVDAKVDDKVYAEVYAKVNDGVQLQEYISPYIYGCYDSYIFSFYDFMMEVLKIEFSEKKLYDIWKNTMNHERMWCLENCCIISEKPKKILTNDNGLHCENGLAVEYADDFGVYSLNGVTVAKKIVMTDPDDFTSDMILKEKNVEVRREIVRKIGITRLIKITKAEKIDTKDDYELYSVPIGNERQAKALKMKNPSLSDVWHFEFVDTECRTVQDALYFRNQTKENPVVLT